MSMRIDRSTAPQVGFGANLTQGRIGGVLIDMPTGIAEGLAEAAKDYQTKFRKDKHNYTFVWVAENGRLVQEPLLNIGQKLAKFLRLPIKSKNPVNERFRPQFPRDAAEVKDWLLRNRLQLLEQEQQRKRVKPGAIIQGR